LNIFVLEVSVVNLELDVVIRCPSKDYFSNQDDLEFIKLKPMHFLVNDSMTIYCITRLIEGVEYVRLINVIQLRAEHMFNRQIFETENN